MHNSLAAYFPAAAACVQLLGLPAYAVESLPSHCSPTEQTYLTATMANFVRQKDGVSFVPNGKILSICTDTSVAPAAQITYRYGAIGSIELEKTATRQSPFSRFERSTSPHTGEEITFFKKGKYTYYVAEATGQGHGITLKVFESKKRIAYLFSGTRKDQDYQSWMFGTNTFSVSPALVYRRPTHVLD